MTEGIRSELWLCAALGAFVLALLGAAVGSAGSATGVAAAGSGACFTAATYGAGTNAYGAAAADLNGDGLVDLGVTNWGSNSISVLLNGGDGTFGAAVDYPVGQFPQSLAHGDLDRNGTTDVVVANSGSDDVSVLLGNADGALEAAGSYPIGVRSPNAVLIDLLDADTIPDLAVANYGPDYDNGTVAILLGRGDGSFEPPAHYPAGVNPAGMNEGDFDNDGNVDLAVVDNNGGFGVSILLGHGDGSFESPLWNATVGINPRGPAVGDFDRDGNVDLGVGTYQYPSGVSVLLGNGDGTFGGPVHYETGEGLADVEAADVNGDAVLDLVTSNSTGSVSILTGNGDGTFGPHRDVGTGQRPASLALADVNDDGHVDVAVSDFDANAVSVLLGGAACGPPQAGFSYSPDDPSTLDRIQFVDQSSDPEGGAPIVSHAWDFGDGTTSAEANPTHRYPQDGSYSVKLKVATDDRRSASAAHVVEVRTHDVAMAKVAVPQTASSTQTRSITIGISNTRYPETVEVQLFRSTQDPYEPFELVGTLRQSVPVRPGGRTTNFAFSYTFTADDAALGKVTFEAVATIVGLRDASPGDNVVTSSPTRVSR